MKKHLPRIMIGAPKSGSGKTLITCGLLNLLKRKNNIISYKCGPDYIDPMFHRQVLQIDGGNLDSYFLSKNEIVEILNNTPGDMALIEGVMGLYDGLELTSLRASSYEIAEYTNTPILLVVDGKGAGRTLISTIKGICNDDDLGLIKGIIINNISETYYEGLKPVLTNELEKAGISAKLLGFIPRIKDISIDSRHLGLIMPSEIENIKYQMDIISEAIENSCNMDEIVALMDSAEDIFTDEAHSRTEIGNCGINIRCRLAVARDEAFSFYYKENIELLKLKGVEIVQFSPLNDETLPKDIDGILLGGGYPENYLDKLSANKSMLNDIREKVSSGIPCLAECGGFMYLHKYVESVDGIKYELANVLDGSCYYTGHLVRFGYAEFKADTKDSIASHISGIKGHEFHYYDSTCNGDCLKATKPNGAKSWRTSIANMNQLMGFPHLYYYSCPEFVDAFVERMCIYKENR